MSKSLQKSGLRALSAWLFAVMGLFAAQNLSAQCTQTLTGPTPPSYTVSLDAVTGLGTLDTADVSPDLTYDNGNGICGILRMFIDNGGALGTEVTSGLMADCSTFPVGACSQSYNLWVLYDSDGNPANDTRLGLTVTFVDDTPPIAPTMTTDTVACDMLASFAIPTFTDNCDGAPTVTTGPVVFTAATLPGSCPIIGYQVASWTAEDNCGNVNVVTDTTYVIDSIPPVIVGFPNDTMVDCTFNPFVIPAGFIPSFTTADLDDCGAALLGGGLSIDSLGATVVAGVCPIVDTTFVSWAVSDSCMNMDTLTWVIVRQDLVGPVSNLPDTILTAAMGTVCEDTVTINLAGIWNDFCSGSMVTPNPTTTFGLPVSIITNNASTFEAIFQVGTTGVVVSADDACGNTGLDTVYVVVQDTSAPIIVFTDICDTIPTTIGECSNLYMYQKPGAAADCAGSITAKEFFISGPDTTAVKATFRDTLLNFRIAQFPVGTTEIGYAFDDGSGNADTAFVKVVVVDDDAPVAICKPLLEVNAHPIFGNAVVNAIDVNNGSYDNCNEVVMGLDTTITDTANFLPVLFLSCGEYPYALLVSDTFGNADTCYGVINVVDVTTPIFGSCPPSVLLDADAASCDAEYTYNIPDVQDNCEFAVYEILFHPNGTSDSSAVDLADLNTPITDTYPIGLTTVQYIAVDSSLNVQYCIFTIEVQDNEAPVISSVPADLTVAADANCVYQGPAGLWVPADIVVSDNCGVETVYTSPAVNSAFPLGTTVVQVFAIDSSGNQSLDTFLVTVEDQTPPSIVCPSDQELRTICPDAVLPSYVGLSLPFDNCGIDTVLQSPAPNGSDLATILGGTPLDGDVITITLTAYDNAGLTQSCTFDVTLIDDGDPIPVNAGAALPEVVEMACSGVYEHIAPKAYANDCLTPDPILIGYALPRPLPTGVTQINDSVYHFAPRLADYNITWAYTDGAGNITTQTQVFRISPDTEAPMLACPSDVTVAAGSLCTAANVANISMSFVAKASYTGAPGTYTDNCGATVDYSLSGVTSVARKDGSNAGIETFNKGITTVTYYVTDAAGNESSCSFEVEVLDLTPPFLVNCPIDATFSTNPDSCFYKLTWQHPAVNDNCFNNGGVTLTVRYHNPDGSISAPFTLIPGAFMTRNFPVGTSRILYTVTDAVGLTATCDAYITVQDNQLPSFTCPAASPYTRGVGDDGNPDCMYRIQGTEFDITNIKDNCGILSVTYQIDANAAVTSNTGKILPNTNLSTGGHTILWTVTDVNGNTQTCAITVNVVDDEAPTMICAGFATLPIANSPMVINPALYIINYLDNCDDKADLILSASPNSVTCAQVGTTIDVELKVTDLSGNFRTCPVKLTIVDTDRPVAVCNNYTAPLDANGQVIVTGQNIGSGSTDNCGIDEYFIALDADNDGVRDNNAAEAFQSSLTFTCANLDQVRRVFLKVVDVNGNESNPMCSSFVTIVDQLAPTTVCKAVTQMLGNTAGTMSIAGRTFDNGSTDNCTSNANLVFEYTIDRNGDNDFSDPGEGYATSHPFDCADVGRTFNVRVRTKDSKGNTSSSCSTTLTVQAPAPKAECKDVTVYLDATGKATVWGFQTGQPSVDDGSYYYCNAFLAPALRHPLSFGLARDENPLNGAPDAAYTSSLMFNCADTGDDLPDQQHRVIMQVTDVTTSKTDTCWSIITVLDTIRPEVTCKNYTAFLDDQGEVTINTDDVKASLTDNCNIIDLRLNRTEFFCVNEGPNNVVLVATDQSGNKDSCVAQVDVMDMLPPTFETENITVQIGPGGTATIIPMQLVKVNSIRDNCGTTSVTASKTTFTCADGVVQTVDVTVTDNHGKSTTKQATVTLADAINPVASCKNITVELGAGGVVIITGTQVDGGSTDNCGIIERTVTPNTFDCSNIGANIVTLTVKDGGNNTATCTATVTVTAPGVNIDADEVAGALGTTIQVPIRINNPFNLRSFQFSAHVTDGTVAQVTGATGTLADGSYNIQVSGNDVTVSWSSATAKTYTPNAIVANIAVNIVGTPGQSTPVVINDTPTPIRVGRECPTPTEFVATGTNGSVTVNNSVGVRTVSGRITDQFGAGINQVTVDVTGGATLSVLTDASGNYTFSVPAGTSVTITPKAINKTWPTGWAFHVNGVTSFDAAVMLQRATNIVPSGWVLPWDDIAADVDKSADGKPCTPLQLTSVDVQALQRLITQQILDLSQYSQASWRFIPKSHVFGTCPFSPQFPESLTLTVNVNTTAQDFTGVKIGDVVSPTGAVPTMLNGEPAIENRNGDKLVFEVADRALAAGEQYTIPFQAKDFADLMAFQMTLAFDADKLEVVDVAGGALANMSKSAFGLRNKEQGAVNMAWFNARPTSVDNGTEVFFVTVKAKQAVSSLQELIQATSTFTKAEAYTMEEVKSVQIDVQKLPTTVVEGDQFKLLQNVPNPFGDETLIRFYLPEAGAVNLTIMDATGKVVRVMKGDFQRGVNEITFVNQGLSGGVYYYQLSTERHSAIKRMVITQ